MSAVDIKKLCDGMREIAKSENEERADIDYRMIAADLIEQQQRDIELLRESNAKLCGQLSVTEHQRDELAAAAERLSGAGQELYEELEASLQTGAQCEHWAGLWEEAKQSTPQANLAERDERLVRDFCDYCKANAGPGTTSLWLMLERFIKEELDRGE